MQLFKGIIIVVLPAIINMVKDKVALKKENKDAYKAYTHFFWGVVFGVVAILCSEWGITTGKAYVSTRNVAVITAGLFVSGPAGIIAGIVAALERWLSVSWGGDGFTLLADVLVTIIAGVLALLLRKIMFEDKRPNWFMTVFCGLFIEVLRLEIIFSTNMNRPDKLLVIANNGTVPTLLINGFSLFLVSFIAYIISQNKQYKRKGTETKPIFETIQNWLLNVIIIAFLAVSVFMVLLETNLANSQIEEQFKVGMEEVTKDVSDASDRYQLKLTNMIASEIDEGIYDLEDLKEWYNVSEINVINKDGIIFESTNPDFIGFDMRSGEQSSEFMCLLDNSKEYAQSYRPITADNNTYMKYAGVRLKEGFVQMGYNADNFQTELNKELNTSLQNRHVGKTGFFIVFDKNKSVVSTSANFSKNYRFAVNQIKFDNLVPNELVKQKINGVEYYCIYNETEGYNLMAFCEVDDAMTTGIISIYIAVFNMVMVFSVLFILVYILIKTLVVNQIISMANSLARITEGNLNEVVNVRSNAEFASLSDDINSTVDTLKRYIDEAASRIDAELEFAKSIQLSAMPSHFPAFPSRSDLDIYARMDTAKEVGGDFYDFYFTDNDTFNFMIADVSGKGIPAAMFMMRAKSVLHGQSSIGHEINDVFSEANDMLCAENEANMFVTAWQGQINLATGELSIANAGHNPAIIKRVNEPFEYLRLKPNLVLGSMDGIPYRKHEFTLNPGDIIYLYTDGVTEATNADEELYGEDRLIELLNSKNATDMKEICDAVKADVDLFVGDAPQFDDITMVSFIYKG